MNEGFKVFQERIDSLRRRSSDFGDADELDKRLDRLEAMFVEAAKATDLKSVEPVKNALQSLMDSADVLAHNILFCDTGSVSPEVLLGSVVKFQALERLRSVFEPTAAVALLESVERSVEEADSKEEKV